MFSHSRVSHTSPQLSDVFRCPTCGEEYKVSFRLNFKLSWERCLSVSFNILFALSVVVGWPSHTSISYQSSHLEASYSAFPSYYFPDTFYEQQRALLP